MWGGAKPAIDKVETCVPSSERVEVTGKQQQCFIVRRDMRQKRVQNSAATSLSVLRQKVGIHDDERTVAATDSGNQDPAVVDSNTVGNNTPMDAR